MVKLFFAIALLCFNIYADEFLNSKIKSFISEKEYVENKDYKNIKR